MAAPTTTIELLDQVVALGLCDSAKLTGTFPADNPLPESLADVIDQLVRYGVCTRYQGRMLLAGKGRKLVLGKYRLLRPLGKGGGGSVFLGEHTDIRRRVAVKVLRGGSSADTLAVERFKREARAAAALDHPNLVRLFDFGVSHGVPYLVMEYAPGKTLQQLLDVAGPLTVPAAVYVATQTAIGLGHAHARGIVHRDVKPLNLMASAEGQVKLLDMGLARALDRSEDRLTEQADLGTIAGTIDFMPPEQCSGLGVDERTDIYALGATLFTLLSGRPVFLGTPAEKIAQHQTVGPPVLDQMVPTIPPSLARVVEKMLVKRPADRFASCDEVVAALAPWCPSEPPSLGVIDPQKTVNLRASRKSTINWSADESRRTTTRRWRWAVLAAGVLVVISSAVGLSFALGPRPTPVADTPTELQLAGNWSHVNELVFTQDGTRLLGVDWSGGLCVWDTTTGKLIDRLTVGKADATGNHLTLTPDGRVLVCGARMPTTMWDLEKREWAFTYEYRTEETWSVVPSPDGKAVLIEGPDKVDLRDAETGRVLRTFEAGLGFVWYSTFSPNGKLVAAGGRIPGDGEKTGTVAIWETETGKLVRLMIGHTGDVRWVAFSPDGTKVASCGFDNSIRVWNVPTGECEKTFTDTNLFVERVQFLSDGRILSVAACDWSLPEPHTSTVSVWDLVQPDSAPPVWSRTFSGRATSVAYSPTTGLYAVANKWRQVWLMKAPPAMSGK